MRLRRSVQWGSNMVSEAFVDVWGPSSAMMLEMKKERERQRK